MPSSHSSQIHGVVQIREHLVGGRVDDDVIFQVAISEPRLGSFSSLYLTLSHATAKSRDSPRSCSIGTGCGSRKCESRDGPTTVYTQFFTRASEQAWQEPERAKRQKPPAARRKNRVVVLFEQILALNETGERDGPVGDGAEVDDEEERPEQPRQRSRIVRH